jgi:hypothetical protein
MALRRWRSAVWAAGARRPRVAGRVGVPVSLLRPRSATACGLRATALRCSAPRASSRSRRRSRPVLAAERTAPTRAPRPRWRGATLGACAPRRSRNRETATPAAPLNDVSSLGRKKIEVRSRRRARTSGTLGRRASSRAAHWRADPSRGAALPAGRAKRGLGARVGAVRWAVSTGLLRRRPCDEALGDEQVLHVLPGQPFCQVVVRKGNPDVTRGCGLSVQPLRCWWWRRGGSNS